MSAAPGPDTGRPRRRSRRAAALGLAFALALAAVWAFFAQVREGRTRRDAWPQEEGTLRLPGLEEPVVVARDRRGIPHVEARSEEDALRALGFVHAQDRLAQMAWLVRSARGRAAEWAGPAALEADRRARVLGIGRHADAQAAALERATRRALEAYAEGVNARLELIRTGQAAPPSALESLAAELEPWTPADSLAVVKLYGWALSGPLETPVVLLDLIRRLGGLAAHLFFPPDAGLRVTPQGTEARAPSRAPPAPDPLRLALGLQGPAPGSSAWVVGGRHARSGKPLLAADVHLEASVPALYYEAHLRGGALDVAGATIPGVPVFWSGRNPDLAWAAVHARAVVADLYVETLDPGDRSHYHDGRQWQPLEVRSERLEIRGEEPQQLEVRETRHGPLVNDLLADGAEREPLALAWSGAWATPGIGAFLAVARAQSGASLRKALAGHHDPVVAVAWADAHGEAGVQVAGWIPRRGLPSGLVPVPGRSPLYDWHGRVPYDELPHAELGEGQGWLVAADAPLAGARPDGVEWLWRSGERAARIDALLRDAAARGPLDAGALAALQVDVHSGGATALVARALELAGPEGDLGAEAREVAALLRAWDGDAGADSVGAAAYHVFLRELVQQLFAERLGPELLARYQALPHANAGQAAATLLAGALGGDEDPSGWNPPAGAAEAVRRSLRATWLHLSVRVGQNREKWAWGRLHSLSFRPLVPLGPAPRGGRELGPFPYPGDGETVLAGGYEAAHSFEARIASIYRLAVDTGERGHALSSLAPGQSEHPGHLHYASGLERWLAGRPSLLLTSPLLVEEGTLARLVLEPQP